MIVKELSICFTTKNIDACKAFYEKYLGAIITFDSGWYLDLTFRDAEKEFHISFMNPQNNEPEYLGGAILNLLVEDVDKEYEIISNENIPIVTHIQDNPWGDRSFCINDPIGNRLYIYKNTQPTEEYAAAFATAYK